MMKINCLIRTKFHTLTHFNEVSDIDYNELIAAGFSESEIDAQLSKPGSKFYTVFATSLGEVVSILQKKFPASFIDMKRDNDGRVRLSFQLNEPIGICNLINTSNLTTQEHQTIETTERNGLEIKKVKSNRIFPTYECQLVLEPQGDSYNVRTLFPGMMAPPLPRKGESDPFWDSHIFIEPNA